MKDFRTVLVIIFALAAAPAFAASSALSPEANTAYLAANAQKSGVMVRPSGLQYRIIHSGYGKRPLPTDDVTFFYTGMLINSQRFDGTEPDLPMTHSMNGLIQGWKEALSLMREGDHWQIVVPAQLGYGAQGSGGGAVPPNQTLVFDLTLVTVTTPKKAPGEDQDDGSGNGDSGGSGGGGGGNY